MPPSANAPLIIPNAPTTAATPAAIATRFAGKGSFAPLAVALATASPLLAAVLVALTPVFAAVIVVFTAVAAVSASVEVVSISISLTIPDIPSAI